MNIEWLTTTTLADFHAGVRRCMAEDDARLANAEWTWGVREYQDWRQHSDAIEAELRRRRVLFAPVRW